MRTLRDQVLHLAARRRDLRGHLLPLVAKSRYDFADPKVVASLLSAVSAALVKHDLQEGGGETWYGHLGDPVLVQGKEIRPRLTVQWFETRTDAKVNFTADNLTHWDGHGWPPRYTVSVLIPWGSSPRDAVRIAEAGLQRIRSIKPDKYTQGDVS